MRQEIADKLMEIIEFVKENADYVTAEESEDLYSTLTALSLISVSLEMGNATGVIENFDAHYRIMLQFLGKESGNSKFFPEPFSLN